MILSICLVFPGKGIVHYFIFTASFRTVPLLFYISFQVLEQFFLMFQTHQ